MELLFWNMGKNDNAALALECMCSNGVSVAAFAEYSGTEFSDELLRGTEYRVLGFGGCDKIQVFVDRAVDVINCFEESRFTVFVLVCSGVRFVFAATHLVDRMSSPGAQPRLEDIRQTTVPRLCPPQKRSREAKWQSRPYRISGRLKRTATKIRWTRPAAHWKKTCHTSVTVIFKTLTILCRM